MTRLASSHVESLKTSLLQLSPTGNDGFEGLMATVLTDISRNAVQSGCERIAIWK